VKYKTDMIFYPAINTFAVQICYANIFFALFVLDEYTFRTIRINFSAYE